jgi:hypothetical protein
MKVDDILSLKDRFMFDVDHSKEHFCGICLLSMFGVGFFLGALCAILFINKLG